MDSLCVSSEKVGFFWASCVFSNTMVVFSVSLSEMVAPYFTWNRILKRVLIAEVSYCTRAQDHCRISKKKDSGRRVRNSCGFRELYYYSTNFATNWPQKHLLFRIAWKNTSWTLEKNLFGKVTCLFSETFTVFGTCDAVVTPASFFIICLNRQMKGLTPAPHGNYVGKFWSQVHFVDPKMVPQTGKMDLWEGIFELGGVLPFWALPSSKISPTSWSLRTREVDVHAGSHWVLECNLEFQRLCGKLWPQDQISDQTILG